jgi:DNA-directed RNA polymerase specialized sigma24 family protein
LRPSPTLFAQLRSSELRIAHTFKECSSIGGVDIEELFDATTSALLARRFESEDHLRYALRLGIKRRALNLYRDRAIHSRILEQAAPAMRASREEQAWREAPERACIAREDEFLAAEFLAQLTKRQREVFALIANGRRGRAIATELKIDPNVARNEIRFCEYERQRFLTIYEAGRLCGYRSRAIDTVLSGRRTNELARDQARVHLSYCRSCQAKAPHTRV